MDRNVGSEVWLLVDYCAYHILDAPTGQWSSGTCIFWKDFTNIDRIVMKVSSNQAPGCIYEHGLVYMLAPKSGCLLIKVLITFWMLQLENGAQKHNVEERHQCGSNCYEIWLKRSASIHLRTWDRLLLLS